MALHARPEVGLPPGGEAEEEERPGSNGEDDSEVELAVGDIAVSQPLSPLPRARRKRRRPGWLENYYTD